MCIYIFFVIEMKQYKIVVESKNVIKPYIGRHIPVFFFVY